MAQKKTTILKKYHFSAGFNHFDLKFSEASWDTGLQKCIKFHKLSLLSSGEVRLESQTCNFQKMNKKYELILKITCLTF